MKRRQQERLGIRHILWWMVGIAVCMSIGRYFELIDDFGRNQSPLAWFWRVHALFSAVLSGMCVAALCDWMAVRFRRRRSSFPTQPGHLLLLVSGVTYLVWTTTRWLLLSVDHRYSLNAFVIAQMLVVSAFCVAATAIRSPDDGHWQVGFITLAGFELMIAGFYLVERGLPTGVPSIYVHIPIAFVRIGVMGSLLIVDVWRQQKRDLLHFAGVIQLAFDSLLNATVLIVLQPSI